MNPRKTLSKTMALEPETAAAMDEVCEWMREASGGCLVASPRERNRQMNLIVRAALEAVLNYEPEAGYRLAWPLAFTARQRTDEERAIDDALSSA